MTENLHRDPTLRDELLPIEEVAELLRMPIASLRYWRVLDTGPRGFIIGRGSPHSSAGSASTLGFTPHGS